MVKSKPKTVDEIFSKIGDPEKTIAERLRTLIKGTLPKAVENVRRGRITYALDGKDFAAIRPANGHVDLLFMHGVSLSSPQLKGQGNLNDPKHMQVVSLKSFDENEAKRLLNEAATV
jgi:hypothetical protein